MSFAAPVGQIARQPTSTSALFVYPWSLLLQNTITQFPIVAHTARSKLGILRASFHGTANRLTGNGLLEGTSTLNSTI